jgi:hypothetical protein
MKHAGLCVLWAPILVEYGERHYLISVNLWEPSMSYDTVVEQKASVA